jgi:hypothetical protein
MARPSEDWAVVYVEEPFASDTTPLHLVAERLSMGFAVTIRSYLNEKAHIMMADKDCHVEATSGDGNLITNNCIIHHGDSGGPLMSADEFYVIGVPSSRPDRPSESKSVNRSRPKCIPSPHFRRQLTLATPYHARGPRLFAHRGGISNHRYQR